jgi:6-phosphogluconate dehydrogenase
MRLGMIGLGRMGGNMSERLRQHGHEVVGYDRDPSVSQVPDLAGLVEALGDEGPRVAWVMVPSGTPTDDTILALRDLLRAGDVVVDGGNSNWNDSTRHAEELAQQGIGFVDCGTSGGVWGLQEGYCLMVGGAAEHVALVQPAFDALAPDGGFAHVGPPGAGHFTKMVHNGIEYGLMHAYAEGYELLTAADIDIDANAALAAWRHGSVVRSWLLDLLVLALEDDPALSKYRGYASDSGEGRWTVQEAVRLAVPLNVISSALFARFTSRQETSPSMKAISALRSQFGGHAEQAPDRRPAEAVEGPEEGKVEPG